MPIQWWFNSSSTIVVFNGASASKIGTATTGDFSVVDGDVAFDGQAAARIGTSALGEFSTPATVGTSINATVGGQTVSILVDTIRVQDRIMEPSIASFRVKTPVSTTFQQGEDVELRDAEDDVIFAGFIQEAEKDVPSPGAALHSLQCNDMHWLCDKRVVRKAYQNMTCGAIVSDLITTYLDEEGVDLADAGIQDGPTVTAITFNWVSLTDAFEQLANLAGFYWRLGFAKDFLFVSRDTNAAPWTLTGVDFQRGLRLRGGNSRYRNIQYTRDARDITDTQVETFDGDGSIKSFAVGFPIAKVPTVEVDTGSGFSGQTVGIKGLETGKQWYWSKGDAVVTQDQADTPLSGTDQIRVTYQGMFRVVARSEDTAELIRLRNIDGTSGKVESVKSGTSIDSRQEAFEDASSMLTRFSGPVQRISFVTKRKGLQPGQLLPVDAPEFGFTTDDEGVLIEQIEVRVRSNELVEYAVSASTGPMNGSWGQFFREIFKQKGSAADQLSVGEDEVIAIQIPFSETTEITELVTVNKYSCPVPNTTLFPGTSLFPC